MTAKIGMWRQWTHEFCNQRSIDKWAIFLYGNTPTKYQTIYSQKIKYHFQLNNLDQSPISVYITFPCLFFSLKKMHVYTRSFLSKTSQQIFRNNKWSPQPQNVRSRSAQKITHKYKNIPIVKNKNVRQ